MNITQHEVPPSVCPRCNSKIEGATGVTGRGPSPGDWTVCLYCAAALRFDEQLAMRLATAEEVAGLDLQTRRLIENFKHLSKQFQGQRYEAQLELMLKRAQEWRMLN